jgi:pyruvate dehydrogenase (quinone)
MVKLEMEVAGLPDSQTDLLNPDFEMIAKAMGMKGITVERPEDTEDALKEAFAYNGPVLVNIFTDPAALAMPPKINLEMMKGFTLSMGKLMLGGDWEEVVDTVKSNYKHLNELI